MPTNFVASMLRNGLVVRVIGRRLIYYRVLPSTMDEAARLAEEGIEEGAVVVAEEQTAGRGRVGRPWESPKGNLLLSIVLRPTLFSLRYLSMMAGVAAARAVASATGIKPSLKWPNDVQIAGKKAGGILVENSLSGNEVRYAVVGIGLNVEFDPTPGGGLSGTATGLAKELGRPVSREQLLRYLLQELDSLYRSLQQGSAPLEEWRGLLETLGKQVSVKVSQQGPGRKGRVYAGLAEDVDAAGNLLLRTGAGRRMALSAGEVSVQES